MIFYSYSCSRLTDTKRAEKFPGAYMKSNVMDEGHRPECVKISLGGGEFKGHSLAYALAGLLIMSSFQIMWSRLLYSLMRYAVTHCFTHLPLGLTVIDNMGCKC